MPGARPAIIVDGRELPRACVVGAFELELDEVTAGRWDVAAGVARGVAGRAWLHLPCALPPIYIPVVGPLPVEEPGVSRLTQRVGVVEEVLHPQTEISLSDAIRLQPDAAVGDSISLDLTLDRGNLQRMIDHGRGVIDWIETDPSGSGILVEFTDLTLEVEPVPPRSRVVAGVLTGPVAGPFRQTAELVIAGFTLVISTFELSPESARATARLVLPGGLADVESCQPAIIDLGSITLSPTCDYYFDAPGQAYGPWLLGDTGLVVQGTGYVLDLSSAASPPPWPPSWTGLVLGPGTATGEQLVPEPCNSGYLRGTFGYAEATVVSAGFFGRLSLVEPVSFAALNPLGQTFTFADGDLEVWSTRIFSGELRNGVTELPVHAVCNGTAGHPVKIAIASVAVQPNLDLSGVLDAGHQEISWGELTRPGHEVVAWTGVCGPGYVYLPAGPLPSYSPVASGSFVGPTLGATPDADLAQLEANQVAGVSFPSLAGALVFSLDRPGGRANPIKLNRLLGWLRVGVTGVDGALSTYYAIHQPLGDPAGPGYVGNAPFDATLFARDKRNLLAEFVTSAAFDSNFAGALNIPQPCGIAALGVTNMKLTSTASLVGGDVTLPTAGVPLDYWQLQLVPTGDPTHAGVVSVRTGRVLLTAAGIGETVHFAKPFGLTWGELLADGDLGELFLDFNNWGQRFDGLNFDPHEVALSTYDSAHPAADPYLGVWGQVSFPFFGLHPINVRDAVGPNPPPRSVTVPKAPITPHAGPTQLALSGVWHDINSNDLATVTCAEADVDYNVAAQRGFVGTGGSELSFLNSNPLHTDVLITDSATDIHFDSLETHDINLSVVGRLGGMSQIAGCLRIDGPTISRMSIFGSLEQSAAAGSIFGPKAGYEAEINITITATTFDFYLSGDMLVSVGLVDLEASATVHLLYDCANGSAEGELNGNVDADAVVHGLRGEGQLTWYVGPAMQYMQGRVKVVVFSLVNGEGLEGGFFIGNSTPKALAWVLNPTDTHFGLSTAILPATITGVYGYGQVSTSESIYVLSGGIDIYVGAGAFSAALGAGGPVAPFAGNPLLPYVAGACGVSLHGEILGGLVSASAWANLSMRGPVPLYFDGTAGLQGCVAWVLCASTTIDARLDSSGLHLS